MFELILRYPSKDEDRPSTHLTALLEGLKQLEAQKVKVYRTVCQSGSKRYSLITTSKEMHLLLGTIGGALLEHFCALLEETFRRPSVGTELLLFEGFRGDEKKTGILVSFHQLDPNNLKFTLSPAH